MLTQFSAFESSLKLLSQLPQNSKAKRSPLVWICIALLDEVKKHGKGERDRDRHGDGDIQDG